MPKEVSWNEHFGICEVYDNLNVCDVFNSFCIVWAIVIQSPDLALTNVFWHSLAFEKKKKYDGVR